MNSTTVHIRKTIYLCPFFVEWTTLTPLTFAIIYPIGSCTMVSAIGQIDSLVIRLFDNNTQVHLET